MEKKTEVKLLWTGGWDSTFRLLDLLLIQKVPVQPYYIIDPSRPSMGLEIKTMRDIKRRLFGKAPETCDLLGPTLYYEVMDIEPDAEITRAFEEIRRQRHIPRQYGWIARFCKQHGLENVEMCVIGALPGSAGKDRDGLDDRKLEENQRILFKYYSFPVRGIAKLKMKSSSTERGWDDIMNMTVFCRQPDRKLRPCGICDPCRIAVEQGCGWRLPLYSRIRYSVRRVVKKLGIRA